MDRERSAQRIGQDIETLSGSDYTRTDEAIRRYAYTPEYRNTLAYFTRELEALGFTVEQDPVGTLYARNRAQGEPVFGVGSHCDSNRNGGRYDGTMGVVTALEVCRLNEELGFGLPLQVISFLEEEGSGFGQMLLGSRIIAQRVEEEDLRLLLLRRVAHERRHVTVDALGGARDMLSHLFEPAVVVDAEVLGFDRVEAQRRIEGALRGLRESDNADEGGEEAA